MYDVRVHNDLSHLLADYDYTVHYTAMNSMLGVGIFSAVTGFQLAWAANRRNSIRAVQLSTFNARDIISRLENRIHLDEGRRGIDEIIIKGELYNAAAELLQSKRVAIITGFPCLLDFSPPTETDGPLGAVAIARALVALGKDVVIATDECNEEPILAAVAASGIYGQHLQLECFAGGIAYDDGEARRLKSLANSIDMVIAIERAGPCSDGQYKTMRGFDMSHLLAPLELLLMSGHDFADEGTAVPTPATRIRSIGIGDGGNEVGMGKAYQRILKSKITNAEEIACVVPSDHLIVASVSNWGGYALAAALAVLSTANESTLAENVARCLVSSATETEICARMVDGGARDGISKKQELSIDGMTLGKSLEVLEDLRKIAMNK